MNRFFAGLIAVSFYWFSNLIFPSEVFASALIGTHLGVGDINHQVAIIQNILIPNGLEPGSPITVMANANGVADHNQKDIENLASAVRSGGYFPIVRLTHVCEKLDSDDLALTAVNRIKQLFGQDTIVIYGNEVNNKSLECADANRFRAQFNSIKHIYNVIPGPLDFYNSVYPASSYEARDLYNNLSAVAGNAYGCEGESASSCPVPETRGEAFECTGSVASYQRGYVEYGSANLYLTEFSLFPAGPDPVPDTNLRKVANFIQTCGPQTGAIKITPLIRNPCAGVSGEWLLYINGEFYTSAGDQVDVDRCKATGSGFRMGDYPNYEINLDDYFIQTIIGLTEDSAFSSPKKRNYKDIRADLIAQGYHAYCAVPEQEIRASVNTQAIVEKFIRQYGMPTQEERTVESKQMLNTTDVRAPLFRNTTGKYFLTNSFETFFGFKDVFSTNPQVSEITSAPINSLLDHRQRCIQSVKLLAAQKNMCMKLESEATCGLYAREIPGTDFTVASLIAEYTKFAQTITPDASVLMGSPAKICEALVDSKSADTQKLKQGMQRLPFFIDQNYRLAFLVASITTKSPDSNFLFNFFTKNVSHPKGVARDEVLAVAFKIPDIGTEKGTTNNHAAASEERGGSIDYPDPIIATRNSLITHQKIQDIFDQREAERENRYQTVGNFDVQNLSRTIFCLEGEGDLETRIGSPACKDHLTKALVDIINAFAGTCTDPEAERVRILGQSGNLGNVNDARRTFLIEYSERLLRNLFMEDPTHPSPEMPQQAELEIDTIFELGANPSGNNASIKFFLVYPMGYELGYVTSVLENSFFTREQLDKLKSDPSRLELLSAIGGGGGFRAGTYRKSFLDLERPSECRTETDEAGNSRVVCNHPEEKFEIRIIREGAGGFGMLGGYLGFWVRTAQLVLNPSASKAYTYIKSCKTTEEFLLGRCGPGNSNIFPRENLDDHPDPRCRPILDNSNPCSVDNLVASLKQRAPQLSELELQNRAKRASIICHRESGGNPNNLNDSCVSGRSVDYSVGLFQINLLVAGRCPENPELALFSDGSGNRQDESGYNAFNLPCTVNDQEALDRCVAHFQDPAINIEWMWNKSNNGENFHPAWSAAFPQYCNIENYN